MPAKVPVEDQAEPALQPHLRWRSGFHWFAAEFLVVVSGILVALMLNAWWKAREAAAIEKQVLERLHKESENIVKYFDDHIMWNDQLNEDRELAVLALDSNVTIPHDLNRFRNGIFFAFVYPAVSPPRSVYDEVIQTGQFANVTSVQVRSDISSYYGKLDWLQSQLMWFRQAALPGIEFTMTFPYDYSPGSDVGSKLQVDPVTLRTDPHVRHTLIYALRNQVTFQQFRREVHDEARAMCATLAKELGVGCVAGSDHQGAE